MTHSEYRDSLKKDRQAAQRRLFDVYLNYVYTVVYSRLRSCGSREDIDECVSDVFAEVFSSYDDTATVSGDMKGFIGTVAARRAALFYRRLSRVNSEVRLDDELSEAVKADDDVSSEAEKNEQRRALLEAVESLGEPDSVIIMQKYFYRRRSSEIAKAVHLSPAMVRVRSSRALKKLRKLLEEKDISL